MYRLGEEKHVFVRTYHSKIQLTETDNGLPHNGHVYLYSTISSKFKTNVYNYIELINYYMSDMPHTNGLQFITCYPSIIRFDISHHAIIVLQIN